MIIKKEVRPDEIQAWGGAVERLDTIINENKIEQFDELINELYPDGINETELNDELWFNWEYWFTILGIDYEKED